MAYRIYRVEHIKSEGDRIGDGCYTSDAYKKRHDMSASHNNNQTHPSIRDEFDDWRTRESFYRSHYCAFRNVKQMTQWFADWLPDMLQHDLVVNEYTVTEFLIGHSKRQIMFHPDNVVKRKTVLSGKGGLVRISLKITQYLSELPAKVEEEKDDFSKIFEDILAN